MRRTHLPSCFILAVTLAVDAHAYSGLFLWPTCAGGADVSLTVRFEHMLEPPSLPPLPPEWVGYDLYRRTFPGCEWPGERINAEIIPRPPENVHEVTYVDTPPGAAGTHQYTVLFVDAERRSIRVPSCYDCGLDYEGRYGAMNFASCPPGEAPVTIGRIVDWGWALYVHPCQDGCWPGGYFQGEPWETELRPFAGTLAMFRFYGGIFCCSVEGPSIGIQRYEPAQCGPTPVARASWGRLKTIYR